MFNPESEYQSFITHHKVYERKALKLLLKEFRSILGRIPFDNITYENAEYVVPLNIHTDNLEKVLFQIYYTTMRDYGNYYARKFRRENPITLQQKKFKPLPFFNEELQRWLVGWFSKYGLENVKTISQTLIAAVLTEVKISRDNNEDVYEMAERIRKKVNSPTFYKWQALRIARTETSSAMNSSKELAVESSGVIMDKIWIGRNDGRERDSHIAMNNKKVAQGEKFNVGGVMMKYPGDRENGTAAEIINCRCTFGYVGRRDENGMLMFKD